MILTYFQNNVTLKTKRTNFLKYTYTVTNFSIIWDLKQSNPRQWGKKATFIMQGFIAN